MSNFTLKQDGFHSYTSIPNCFIEQFMPYAAGEFVKIYIYLLKCVSENKSELSISRIADAFNNTEKDVVRALKYWQRKGLLRLTFDDENALTSLHIVSLTEVQTGQKEPVQEVNILDAPIPGQPRTNVGGDSPIPARKEYSREQIRMFSEQEELILLFYSIQKYLGRSLTGQDTNTVLYLYDGLKFPADLIEYLFEYCVSRNHKSIRYIEKTAIAWAESGISTVKAAKVMSAIYTDDCYQVMSAFGINHRKPTKTESDYVSKWTLSYGFDMQIVIAACNKTMDQLHQPNFEYTDAILKNWKSSGVSSVEDIRKLDEAFEMSSRKKEKRAAQESAGTAVNSKFNNFSQRSYDYTALERKLIGKK